MARWSHDRFSVWLVVSEEKRETLYREVKALCDADTEVMACTGPVNFRWKLARATNFPSVVILQVEEGDFTPLSEVMQAGYLDLIILLTNNATVACLGMHYRRIARCLRWPLDRDELREALVFARASWASPFPFNRFDSRTYPQIQSQGRPPLSDSPPHDI